MPFVPSTPPKADTKNDISTLISRKSFANVQFHRYSVFASLFDLRAAVPADEVGKLLDRHSYMAPNVALDEDASWRQRIRYRLVCSVQMCARQEVRMHPLCFLSLLIGPFMLSFESTCSDMERPFMFATKIVHLVSTVLYLFFAVSHFMYSPLNPWPEILKQRRKRFKLLSHKAETLHPALVQQLHARTGPEEEEMNKTEWQNPLTSLRFWVPIFDAVVLLGLIAEVFNLTKEPSRINSWSHWAWLLVSARGFRLLVPPSETVVSNFWMDTLVLGMWLFVVIHLCSCFLSLVSVFHVQKGNTQAWAAEELLQSGGSSCRRFYMLSWYYTATTVTSIGYGDITPQNADERLVASVVMILSQLYFAKVFADLTFLTSMYNQWTSQRHQRMTQTKSALESMNIPRTLIQRVQACQTYVWDMQKERRAKNCFEDLTTQLQEEVKLVLYSRLVMQVPFLQTLDARALRFLISRLSDQVFLPADFIICRGDIGNEMYFLREGYAGVFTCQRAPHWEDEEMKRVEKGSHFGEIALLTGQLRTAWIMARAYCLTSVLQASAIDNLMAQDPTSICTLIKNFQDMLKLKPSLSWTDVKTRLDREFDPDDSHRHDLYDFVCSGDDGLAPAGIITWTRYQVLLSRIQVSQLDQKLLWAELDEEQSGAATRLQ
ncbi:Cyclic nucleotide-gated cation channel alpha-3 (Cone photoreceptor cGMP-gated channel subunit alpha) (Cyclic nucleotide-gated channel alpha-3) (CNG channel alpha-3) (CNG-3) (CNG3) [Durusdinium trenchii]|uniref:Cyclic nucleotide-gated cation channel alpha-3 (Cone photoreceptor cGMP-gated channel subunit alpha) (Cyclic nucleotide-gated channel alpha-3) (CNG channel alpha-3) (CNG-3) (CNG3) n=1 Tax=Durusdinium trenchii TaxID=1381693 RepID=A0ABP0MA83_9DINO